MSAASDIRTKPLTRASATGEYRVYRAGLEWDLTDSIVVDTPDDFKSRLRWRDNLTPYYHQVTNLITFCRRLPVTLLADDVGLGKTISAGLIMSELIARGRLSRILIVCPKLLGPQWQAELQAKFDIASEIAIGRQLLDAEPRDVGAVVTTYNSARLYLDDLPENRFQMLVLDEAHRLRNLYGVQNPPQVARRFHKALEARRFRFVLMLTATPIQNRLWDLYSLIELLTVARGHRNPFGSEEMFARRFIADGRTQARQLKADAREEFRSIVYGYMSRVRRDDAKLYFPERIVQMHRVEPTPAELALIDTIVKPIQKLNRLAQVSILQALTSSPAALTAQLANMAEKATVPASLSESVKAIVQKMPPSAKLVGLGRLVDHLRQENPDDWRLVVFTTRRETQTTIQTFLERQGLTVGIINGDSGVRNQGTIQLFWQNPPLYRVIVSTEAGSEGVNLQVANVLVNFDLPWNPMIVEQRIGRVQRLASDYAHVTIFNITLRGTFEEYIVGRLMEKLQMAAHAVGDVDALLHGSDIGDGDEDAATSFEERILELVLASLAGQDVEEATRLEERSIDDATAELGRSEKTIDALLGSMDDAEYVGPRAPRLPAVVRSMDARQFTLAGLAALGARITAHGPGLHLVEERGSREYVRFEDPAPAHVRSTLYTPGSAAFQRLVSRVIASGVHEVKDADQNPEQRGEEIARAWVENFGAEFKRADIEEARRSFQGTALLRVRVTVAHDAYERLVEVECRPEEHTSPASKEALGPLGRVIEAPQLMGLDLEKLRDAAEQDEAIGEFARFYLERREREKTAADTDERKRRKLHDEFTPRLETTLAGLEGTAHRDLKVRVHYGFDGEGDYETLLSVTPDTGHIGDAPRLRLCSKTGRVVPVGCLAKCAVTGAEVMRHMLVQSDVSGRLALPEFTAECAVSGKRVLDDEAEASAVTGKPVARAFLKTSALSYKRAEPEHFGTCDFTGKELLTTELAVSEISGKRYRIDEQMRSAVSGRTGHKQEFIVCQETRELVALTESEPCQVTGQRVRPGVLEACDVTARRVLPSELDRCAVTGQRALKRLLVASSLSQASMLRQAAIRSSEGKFCTPAETRACFWSGRWSHPDDLRACALTGLPIHVDFATADGAPRLQVLAEMLDGVRRTADEAASWETAASRVALALQGGKCRVEAATLSPAKQHLAICSEVSTWLGMRTRHVGAIYVLGEQSVVGRLATGKRGRNGWIGRAR
jgi:superfamily II DNA or RNA helicase